MDKSTIGNGGTNFLVENALKLKNIKIGVNPEANYDLYDLVILVGEKHW